MTTYIHGMGNISPQKSWGEGLIGDPVLPAGDKFLSVEPDYQHYLEPQQLRRMSRILKMGVSAGKMALAEAGIPVPDGIITGTGYGCLDDTGVFLKRMIENKEQALNPTPFIQSTHNTIGSQIALLLKCQGYNQTYTQGAFSFESALLDAMLALDENPAQTILTGGVDEITATSHGIQKRFGTFKNGIINGEGAAYFALSGVRKTSSDIVLESVSTFYNPNPKILASEIKKVLKGCACLTAGIDLVLVGRNGDKKFDATTDSVVATAFGSVPQGNFKQLCGEYPVAAAFAVWLGSRIISSGNAPEVLNVKTSGPVKNIVIYNRYFEKYHSLIVLGQC